ncbi:nucleoporin protein Ndc1-Nup [Podospora conica]|nr:nucleoporin protein Ndc1-Nup [Schizothecium conicum]
MAGVKVRRAAYKDVIQPALQRRFTATALLLICASYCYAILFANWNSFIWSWFPIGPTGIRTAFLLLGCCAPVLLLRVADYHVGLRTADSGLQAFAEHGFTMMTIETVFSYTLSAVMFSFIYRWSLSEEAGLNFVTYFLSDRARLNEKAVYFTAHFFLLGIGQGLAHRWWDQGRIMLGVAKPRNEEAAAEVQPNGGNRTNKVLERLPLILTQSINCAAVGFLVTAILYPIFLRTFCWRISLAIFRPIYTLPKTNLLPSSLPFSFSSITRALYASFLLELIWTTCTVAFSLFMVKGPKKNGKPLSSESKDPNGSLVNGLKVKKEAYRAFAMWELAIIARDFPDRRKTIYEDIDRTDGPIWNQIAARCLDVLKSIETRIDNYGKPTNPTPTPAPAVEPKRRTGAHPRDEAIFQSTPPKGHFLSEVENLVKDTMTDPGQPSQLSPLAKSTAAATKQKLLDWQTQATGASEDPANPLHALMTRVLRSPLGRPLQHTYRRRLARAVLGADPHGDPSLYANAAGALGLLTVHSLTEDRYGNVQRDVAAVVRTLTAVTRKLDAFCEALPRHWTDVDGERACPEVDEVRDVVRDALAQVVEAFGPYARDLRLGLADMRMAREAVAAGRRRGAEEREDVEMRQVG